MPFFTVIIPTFNREKYISKAIESVLVQTISDFELIIIDDASTDGTEAIVNTFTDSRIRYFKNEMNLERCLSRNRGIEKSKGKYICFLDSDDYHLPNHLEELKNEILLKNEPKAFFFTNAWNESALGERSERFCPDFEFINPFTYFLRYTVNPQRWAVHKEVFLRHLFDPEVTICEDMDTSLRMVAANVPVFQIKKRTTVYVAAEGSFTVSDSNKSEKELFYLKKIFSKPELKNRLSKVEKGRLLSMCFFHLANKAISQNRKIDFYIFASKSFVLYPKGYNGKTNKILFANYIYNLPLFGYLVRNLIKLSKK